MAGFTSANNELIESNNYDGTGDARSYFSGRMLFDLSGVDKHIVTKAMTSFLLGQSIIQLGVHKGSSSWEVV